MEVDGSAVAAKDLRTGEVVPCDALQGGNFVFLAADVPAFGYALYQIVEDVGASSPAPELKAENHSIANRLESIDVIWSPNYEDRYRHNIYFALPSMKLRVFKRATSRFTTPCASRWRSVFSAMKEFESPMLPKIEEAACLARSKVCS